MVLSKSNCCCIICLCGLRESAWVCFTNITCSCFCLIHCISLDFDPTAVGHVDMADIGRERIMVPQAHPVENGGEDAPQAIAVGICGEESVYKRIWHG